MEGLSEGQTLLVTQPSTYLAGASFAVYRCAQSDAIATAPHSYSRSVAAEHRELGESPILQLKAIKNSVEEVSNMQTNKFCSATT